jgi:hypothetical protein
MYLRIVSGGGSFGCELILSIYNRIVSILPNKFEGVIGDHGEEFPIERIRLADNKKYMGSCAHDNSIHFWDVAHLFEEQDDDEDEEAVDESKAEENDTAEASEGINTKTTGAESSEEEKSDSDDDSDSDKEEARKQKRKKGKQMEGRNAKAARQQAASAFFEDL